MRTTARTTIGLVLAGVVAVAGPSLLAVSGHSGNDSGNESLPVTVSEFTTNGGTAQWGLADASKRVTFEVVEVNEVRADGGTESQSVGRSVRGEAVARVEVCDESECVQEAEWRAPLGSPLTRGAVFDVDPTLSTASFTGWLRETSTNAACFFDVRWQGMGVLTPKVAASESNGPDEAHVVEGSAGLRRRASSTSVTTCLGGVRDQVFDGEGALSSRTGAQASEDSEHFIVPESW